MIEQQIDLGAKRDETLYARWSVMRLKLEDNLSEASLTPDVPTMVMEDMLFEANLLNRFISMAPERMRMWGQKHETAAWLHIRALEGILNHQPDSTNDSSLDIDNYPI